MELSVDWARALPDRSGRGIAATLARLVSTGELPPGARLPTVRALARELAVSPTTVAEAWRQLAAAGVIETRGKSGTFVTGPAVPPGPRRFARLDPGGRSVRLDLSAGTPDPALLPDLRPALRRLQPSAGAGSYFDPPVLPALEAVLRGGWPFPPERVTVVDGALDALDRLFGVLVGFGDRVLVENPTFPPILDLVEAHGAEPVPIGLDDDGPRPDAVADAVARAGPVAFVLQPRAHNPTGGGVSPRRAEELAAALAGSSVLVLEDDHAAPIATSAAVSLGVHRPDRTVHIRSFSKSHGPDLRLAAVGGAGEPIERVERRRLLGPAWSSRLLQSVLLDLLTDLGAGAAVARARETYAARRASLVHALAERGVAAQDRDGINVWVRVEDERAALVALAVEGVTVAPGSPFTVAPLGGDHVRVTCATVSDEVDAVADLLAAAASPRPGSARRSG